MKQFLNPRSMITPGIAGATVMLLANGLCQPFPELPVRYVALALSFLVGAVAFRDAALKLHQRTIYWVVNSLVIFVVGFGANSFAREPTPPPSYSEAAPVTEPSVLSRLLPSAYAATPDPKQGAGGTAKDAPKPPPAPPQNQPKPSDKDKSQFFKKW